MTCTIVVKPDALVHLTTFLASMTPSKQLQDLEGSKS
jgi:hypothetical protein